MIFFRFFLSLLIGSILLQADISFAAGSKLPCRLRNSNYCKDKNYFLRDKRDGCADVLGACRRKFCAHNCLGPTAPEKTKKSETVYSLCQANCDPDELTNLSRKERQLFYERFEDLSFKRRKEMNAYVRRVQGPLFDKCNTRCDYDEEAPSCATKEIKDRSQDAWADCAKDCFFLSDIKDHAEQCAQRPTPKPRMRRK